MKQFKSVLAFGDSHTTGLELSGQKYLKQYFKNTISHKELDDITRHLAFPQHVADMLSVPCYNFGMSGCSNARNIRKLVKEIRKYPDSLVLFGWTTPTNTELYYPIDGGFVAHDEDMYLQLGTHWDTVPSTHNKNPFAGHMHFPDDCSIDDDLFIVEQICNNYALDYRHILSISAVTYKKEYESTKVMPGNFHNWCEERHKRLKWGHFPVEAHKDYAKLIVDSLSS